MIATVLVAIAAGCASALMFASMISGALISLLLFWLAPLPLMVAALGWGPLTATIGGIAAATGLGAIFSLPYCVAFAVTVALPAWWLGHLALLGRPATPGGAATDATAASLEWYPVGRLLLWISGFAALTSTTALLTLGTDASTIAGELRRGLVVALGAGDRAPSGEILDALVNIAPSAAVIVAMTTLTLNLWLAAKVTATSGRLRRPWPELRSAELPPLTLAALAVSIALCFAGGLSGLVAQVVATVLMMTYALTGFAVLHTVTSASRGRAWWLGFAYVLVAIFVWPVLAMVALGLADAIFRIRQRYQQGRPPPIPAS